MSLPSFSGPLFLLPPPPRVLFSCPPTPQLHWAVSLSMCAPSSLSGFCLAAGTRGGSHGSLSGSPLPAYSDAWQNSPPTSIRWPWPCPGLGQLAHTLQATSTPEFLLPSTHWLVPRLNTVSLTGLWFKYSCSRKTGLILAGMCWKL